ncbi:MAG: T9SS type A sorting domain-containing protein [Bacteroidetes bacterium]|nr:T9SS type A sorting domain-containing protein [Bacteroidota bacterium]
MKEVLPNIVNVERDEYLSVNYIALIPVLTQAIKEQQSQIEELKNTISKLQNQPTSTQEVDLNSTTLGVALSQNVPNPFTTDTRITYAIPYTFKVAKLGVYDLNGQELKLVALTATTGAVVIQGGNLKPGMYIYTLIVDGKTVASKKMTLTSN